MTSYLPESHDATPRPYETIVETEKAVFFSIRVLIPLLWGRQYVVQISLRIDWWRKEADQGLHRIVQFMRERLNVKFLKNFECVAYVTDLACKQMKFESHVEYSISSCCYIRGAYGVLLPLTWNVGIRKKLNSIKTSCIFPAAQKFETIEFELSYINVTTDGGTIEG